MKRIAQFHQDDNGIGTWQVTCESCPLAPHAAALDQPLPTCLKGMETRMQGHVILGNCKFTSGSKVANDNDVLTVECGHGEP